MSSQGFRSRSYFVLNKKGTWRAGNPGIGTSLYLGTGSQKTWSANNAWPYKGPCVGDVGNGAFKTTKTSYSDDTGHLKTKLVFMNDPTYYTIGPFFAYRTAISDIDFPALAPSTSQEMIVAGSTAISRCLPTNPISGLSNFLGEIRRDGLPTLMAEGILKSKLKDYRKVSNYRKTGDEYLNWEFAWKPFVKDVHDISHAVRESDRIIKQYVAGSGKNLRRRYEFPVVETVSTSVSAPGAFWPQILGGLSSGCFWDWTNAVLTTRTTTYQRRWFSGCFTYHLDLGSDAISKMNRDLQIANKLYGIRPTPDVLYNLAPWSWAADWVSNTGDIVRNVTAFQQDGLVMRYGYIMEHKRTTVTRTLSGYTWRYGNVGPKSMTQTFTREWKQRLRATPYGFGLNVEAFNPRQWAIIAALGISRKPKAL